MNEKEQKRKLGLKREEVDWKSQVSTIIDETLKLLTFFMKTFHVSFINRKSCGSCVRRKEEI